MSDPFKKNYINEYDKNDPSYLRVHDKKHLKEHDESDQTHTIAIHGKPIDSLKVVFARAMQILLDSYSSTDGMNLSHLDEGEREFFSLLYKLRKDIQLLSRNDCSKETSYLKNLSLVWTDTLVSAKRRRNQKKSPPYLATMNHALNSIEEYCQDGGATLGFYLTEHKGSKWFPAPFIQMLSSLNKSFLSKAKDNPLKDWMENLSLLLGEILGEGNS